MNSCELTRQWLLEFGWDQAQRQRAAEVLGHLETCPQCAAAARDYQQIRSTLQAGIQGVPQGGWNAMEKRLASKMPSPQRRYFPWMAVAASVLIAALGYGMGRWTTKPPGPEAMMGDRYPAPPEKTVAFSKTDMARQVKAFDEVSSVFDHRAAWLLVGDKTSDLGVSNQRIVQQEGILLLLQLTMLQSGKVISSADLAILPGQSARLTVPANQGDNLDYRISTSNDQPTRLTISTQLTTPGGANVVAALATTLNVEPGQKLSAGKMVTNSGDYELQLAFGRADLNGRQ